MKIISRLLLLIYSFINLNFSVGFGQEIEWQRTIGGNSGEGLRSTQQTNDGGYILGGSSQSNISGDKTENCLGSSDIWIVKLGTAGNIEWQNTIGGDQYDALISTVQTPDKGYILGANSISSMSVDKSENCIGLTDYWVIKLDSVGGIEWENTIGGDKIDELHSVIPTFDGGYICGGFSFSNISGDKTENNYDTLYQDLWIVKLDIAGNIQWQKTFTGDSIEYLTTMQQTSDSGYVIGAYSNSTISGDKTENPVGSYDIWILKLDKYGNIEWQNTIGGDKIDFVLAIEQFADSGLAIGGYSNSGISGDKAEPSLEPDYWIIKLDATGNIIWENTIGGNSSDQLISLTLCTNGDLLVGGQSSSDISGDKTEDSRGGSDYWVLRLDSFGNIIWQKTIGGWNSEWFGMISETSPNGCILGGSSLSNASFDKTEDCSGYGDYWVVKLSDNFNTITGKLFLDINNNLIYDSIEPIIKNHAVIENSSGRITFSQQDGNYKISVIDTGLHSITTPPAFSLYNPIPGTNSSYFTGFYAIDSLNDFAFQPSGTFNDLCTELTAMNPLRAGRYANYMISYMNVGTTTQNGTILFYPDPNLNYISSSIVPLSISPDSIVWDLGLLTPFQSGNFQVTFQTNSSLIIGTPIITSLLMLPIINDTNPTCNIAMNNNIISGSYDPNDILVSNDTLTTTQIASNTYLDYIIRFQNTGNDTAFNIKVFNPIDTNSLELSSIEFVNSSHPVNLTWIPSARNMEFKLVNILLPDSNVNEPLSHGFVHYRIKPKTTLVAGDSITNNAYIYFDFNSPVVTNTAITLITLPTGINNLQITNSALKVFPNPTKDEITIAGYTLQNNQPAQLKIFDVMGKQVLNQSITNLNSQIVNLKSFASGVYYLQLNSGQQITTARFVKM